MKSCICGKPGDKRCSRCKVVSYCSRECQLSDFKKHKNEMCDRIAGPSLSKQKRNAKTIGSKVLNLAERCCSNPLPIFPSSSTLRMEHVVPYFLSCVIHCLQNPFATSCSPVVSVVELSDRQLALISLNGASPQMQTFTSFQKFSNAGVQATVSTDPANMKKVYLMTSFFAKCNQVTACFGLFIMKSLWAKHQITYGGERVVGWAIQDGQLNFDHTSLTGLRCFNIHNIDVLPEVVQKLRNGETVPTGDAEDTSMTTNSIHVWLTFVTESGRSFDLDLSAFQFGNMESPCIVEISPADAETAFHGLVTRNRILCANIPELAVTVNNLIQGHVSLLENLTEATLPLHQLFNELADFVLEFLINHPAEHDRFADVDYFWKSVQH